MEQQELLFFAGKNAKWYSHFERQFGSLLQHQVHSYSTKQLSHSLVFTQISWKIMSTEKSCTQMFITTLFIIAKNLEAIKCSSVDEWINKLVHP